MRRFSLALVAALTITGLAIVATPSGAANQTVRASVTRARTAVGKPVYVYGRVLPKAPRQKVRLQRYYGNAWHNVKARKLTRSSAYTMGISMKRPGRFQFRVAAPRAASTPFAVTVAAATAFSTGDVFVGVGNGFIKRFDASGALLDTLDTMTGCAEDLGMAFDNGGNLYATAAFGSCANGTVSKFDNTGNLIGPFGSGYSTATESVVVDASGNVFVGQPDGTKQLLEFNSSGALVNAFSPAIEDRGTDWNDLAADQCTMYYTSEGTSVKRFNVCTNTQLSDFATGLPGTWAFALRILRNGDVLVANTSQAVRLDPAGNIVQTYTIPGASYLFALNLDPDGTSFWTADYNTGDVYRVDIGTGNVLTTFNAGNIGTRTSGLAVFGEITVARSTTVTTSLSGGGQSGTSITVAPGTAVTDSATLSGANVATADGTVTYTVYSDDTCQTSIASGGTKTVTSGSVPDSDAVTLNTLGTYYWQASYGGDILNSAAKSKCGDEVETVVPNPLTVSTTLSGGGQTGTNISVPPNTPVTDSATLTGEGAASAGGTVAYTVYSDATCTTSIADAGTRAVSAGAVPDSDAVTLADAGTYYWRASYSGDATHAPSRSACGDEVQTVEESPNQPPVADPQCVNTPKDTPVPIVLTGSDPDGDALTYTIVSPPQHGTLSGTAPNLVYTPDAGYTGSDSFTFTVNDGQVDSSPAKVAITVVKPQKPRRCESRGKHHRDSCRCWNVDKRDHHHLKVRNRGHHRVKVTAWINGRSVSLGEVDAGRSGTYDLAKYMRGPTNNVTIQYSSPDGVGDVSVEL